LTASGISSGSNDRQKYSVLLSDIHSGIYSGVPNCLQGFGCRRAQLHPELAEEQARRRRRRWSCASVKNLEALTWQVGNRERERRARKKAQLYQHIHETRSVLDRHSKHWERQVT